MHCVCLIDQLFEWLIHRCSCVQDLPRCRAEVTEHFHPDLLDGVLCFPGFIDLVHITCATCECNDGCYYHHEDNGDV